MFYIKHPLLNNKEVGKYLHRLFSSKMHPPSHPPTSCTARQTPSKCNPAQPSLPKKTEQKTLQKSEPLACSGLIRPTEAGCSACMFACTPEKGTGSITDGCEPPCGCWELNSNPLEEQSVLLTSEPPLQPSVRSYIPCRHGLDHGHLSERARSRMGVVRLEWRFPTSSILCLQNIFVLLNRTTIPVKPQFSTTLSCGSASTILLCVTGACLPTVCSVPHSVDYTEDSACCGDQAAHTLCLCCIFFYTYASILPCRNSKTSMKIVILSIKDSAFCFVLR